MIAIVVSCMVACLFSLIIMIQRGMRGYGVLAQGLQPTQTPHPVLRSGSEFTSEVDGMDMVYIPAGDFIMGTDSGQSNEKPVHTVYLDAYWIDRTEVSNQMYLRCVETGVCTPPARSNSATRQFYFGNPKYADFPVIYVNWGQAKDYCKWAGRQLPSEAQWEKASRGTDGRMYPWGSNPPAAAYLNFDNQVGDTSKVGGYPKGASTYGVLDTTGNVLEWVRDCFGSGYYGSSPRQNPGGPATCEHRHRVLRGGTSWVGSPHEWSGSADRMNYLEGDTSSEIGFRCALNATSFDLEKLLKDVFDPQPGDMVLVMVDLPSAEVPDNVAWRERRMMAEEWHRGIVDLELTLGIRVHPIFTYTASGAHNGPLPTRGKLGEDAISLDEVLSKSDIVLAMTEFSGTAPLMEYADRYPHLRIASMPMVSRSMEQTALHADFSDLDRKGRQLLEKLDHSIGAKILFSTGHKLFIDLRSRSPHLDGGRVHQDQQDDRVINLPSGEAYIAAYEGELLGQPSLTKGEIPLPCSDDYNLLIVQANRVVDIQGNNSCLSELQDFFDLDPARRNLAELGLGINNRAVISGNVLEEEKVWGVHLGFGLSDHIGGTVGINDFISPSYVVHRDFVFPFSGDIFVKRLELVFENNAEERIIDSGAYTVLTH